MGRMSYDQKIVSPQIDKPGGHNHHVSCIHAGMIVWGTFWRPLFHILHSEYFSNAVVLEDIIPREISLDGLSFTLLIDGIL